MDATRASSNARLTKAAGQRFAWTLAAAFVVFAAIAALRHRQSVWVFAGIAAALLVAGAVAPTRLGPLERGWMALGALLSRVSSPVFLGVVYFGIVTPLGWIRRLVGRDALARSSSASTFWVERPVHSADEQRASLERLY